MRRLELVSFVAGAAAALALLAGWRIPAGHGDPGVGARLAVGRSNVVEVSRTGTVVDARLLPGRSARTELRLHNSGRRVLRLRPRLQLAAGAGLARLLWIDVRAGGAQVYAGQLAALTRSSRPFRLRAGGSLELELSLALPRTAGGGYAGRTLEGSVAFEAVAP